MLERTEKVLLDNSTDAATAPRYEALCREHGFTRLHHDNAGINGGRLLCARHFDADPSLDAMLYFEDDMLLHAKDTTCPRGFRTWVPDLLARAREIVREELTPGGFFAFLGAFFAAYMPVKNLAHMNAQLQVGRVSAERLFHILDEQPTVQEKYDYFYTPEELEGLAGTIRGFHGKVRQVFTKFNNNNRDYPVRNALALRRLLGQAPPDPEATKAEYAARGQAPTRRRRGTRTDASATDRQLGLTM